jgi:uncharacterized protein (TIGR03067 family)
MQPRAILAVLTALVVSVSLSQGGGQSVGLKQLQGTWEVIKEDPKFEPKLIIVFDDILVIEFANEELKGSRIKVDPREKPAIIDVKVRKDFVQHGIYKIEGDMLFLCLAKKKDGDRPTEFKETPDQVLLKAKKTKK